MDLTGLKALVLGGANGLLGQALVRALADAGAEPLALSSTDVDYDDEDALAALLDRESPALVINAVAYTQVDQAEDDAKEADALNRVLPKRLVRLCRARNLLLVHFSTDFVFSGQGDAPYRPDDDTGPVSVYGETKLAGEQAVLAEYPGGALVVRTSWLFGPGRTNFVHKILGLARERDRLTVVHDQCGSPSYTPDLAAGTLALVRADARGVFHLANAGEASWCELATEAVRAAGLPCRVEPVPTSAYPTKAQRPAYSVLDLSDFTSATGITPRPWPQAVRDYVFNDLADELDDT